MSRYTGPRLKVMRALGIDLPGLSAKTIESRPNPPGQHGQQKLQRKKSEFGLQLLEKQKLRYNYGLTETQLRGVVAAAKKQKGATGSNIVVLLERRLDNLIFRAGFAPSIPAARQIVNHGHIELNGKKATIPSMRVRAGDCFGPTEKGRKLAILKETLETPTLTRPEWISFDSATTTATLTRIPDDDANPFPLDLQRVVEYYATHS